MSPVHTRKLLIGISPRLLSQVPPELGFKGKTLQYLEQSVAHWVMGLGAMVVMIPTVEQDSIIRRRNLSVRDYVNALDGLILQGGADIDPKVYGEARSEHVGRTDPVRDAFELELLRAFAAADKPVFGICRGMQLINVAYGGTLYQDLAHDGAAKDPHVIAAAYDEHLHELHLEPGSLMAELHARVDKPFVNSIHHQGVKRLGETLTVEARAPDGVIEAIRKPDARFIMGVQWHPEFHDDRFPQVLPADPLLQAFLEAAAARRGEQNEAEAGAIAKAATAAAIAG